VAAIETGQGKHLDETLVKSITGGDQIIARDLYKGLSTSTRRTWHSSSRTTCR
jgi:phage/plasmid-associated DNA primase